MKPRVTVICDLQFGSTGKGLIAGYLAARDQPDTVVTAWMPNAGHTYIDKDGKKYVHTMLANGIVSPKLKRVLIGPGSVVNLEALLDEIDTSGLDKRQIPVLIHQDAVLLSSRHSEEESKSMLAIGSTRKGSGAAMIEKIQRDVFKETTVDRHSGEIEQAAFLRGATVQVVTHDQYEEALDMSRQIQLEGAQGFSLGINSGFWPNTTSRECTPVQMLSDCLIPVSWVTDVIGTLRTFPIRVANRYNADGVMVGWSGPCYQDQKEISFQDIGQEVEYTTVTKLPRRVFTFSQEQLRQALRRVEPTRLFLNFANYLKPQELFELHRTINRMAASADCGGVRYVGYGPRDDDVVDLGAGYGS